MAFGDRNHIYVRWLLAALALLLIVSVAKPSKWLCGHQDAHGQLPLTPRMMTQYDMVEVAYADQVKQLYRLFYEGFLTRPGHEKEEEVKFMRGLRMARITRERAQQLIFKEPWEIIEPLGQTGREQEKTVVP